MNAMNRASSPRNMFWKLIDAESGMMLNFRVEDPITTTLDSPGSRAEAH